MTNNISGKPTNNNNKDAINTTNNNPDGNLSSTNSKLSNHPKVNISNDDDDVGQTDSILDTSMKSHHHQQTLQETKDIEEYENKCEYLQMRI